MPEMNTVSYQSRILMAMQIGVSAVVALGFYIISGLWLDAAAAAYGGLSAVFISVLLRMDVLKAERESAGDPSRGIRVLMVGAAQRFFAVIALFVVGLVWLKLSPLALCVGFVLAQLCYSMFARVTQNEIRSAGQENK